MVMEVVKSKMRPSGCFIFGQMEAEFLGRPNPYPLESKCASSVLVRSLKRVRAVGRWRSLVRSLILNVHIPSLGSYPCLTTHLLQQNLLFREMPFASQM